MKLTRQGVRDLDFGWKKKPVVATEGQAPGHVEVGQTVRTDRGSSSEAGAPATADAAVQAGGESAPWSPPASPPADNGKNGADQPS